MKKTLLAIAALAAASGSFAQSSVTIYGVLDASIENVKGDKSVTRVSSDNLATSRLGFKGSEDLGSGFRANFALESAVKTDTGANGGGTARFFDRAAWVGLQGGFGELRLGRIDSPIGALAGDTKVLGGQAYDDFKIAPTRAGNSYRRVDNAITYVLPTFVNGLSAQLQYSTAVGTTSPAPGVVGTEASGTDVGKAYGLSVKYAAGPFFSGLGYLSAKDETSSVPGNAVNKKGNATLVYAGFDFGPVKLTGYYDAESRTVAGADRLSLVGVKVGVPFGQNFVVTASLAQASNVSATASASGDHDDATIAAVKAVYTLSKRTALYGIATNVHNESLAALNVSGATVTAGKSSHGIAFGVSHAF